MQEAAIAKTQSEYVKVTREKLLETIQKNAETHEEEWKAAHTRWKIEQVVKLKEFRDAIGGAIDKAQSGGAIEFPKEYEYILEEPKSHKNDYKKVIRRLEMSVDEFIFLSHKDFDRYVMDEWQWKGAFTAAVSNYR